MTRGFTLVEVLVVLLIMGLAAGIVAPALLPPVDSGLDLAGVTRRSQEIAARRAETLSLTVAPDGTWRLRGAATPGAEPLAAGRLDSHDGFPVSFVISPLGLCGVEQSAPAGISAAALDPLTCDLARP